MAVLRLMLSMNVLPPQYKYCVAFEILGGILTLLVLVLSAIGSAETFNVGPRIFVVNLMIFNLIHTVCTMVVDISFVDWDIRGMLGSFYDILSNYSFVVQAWVMLLFNATFTPMMAMSIIIATKKSNISKHKTIVYFACLTLLTDGLPTLFHICSVWATGETFSASIPYMCASYVFYAAHVCITATAMYLLFKKSASHGKAATGNSRKLLYRLLAFSVAPCLLQIPFALQQLTRALRFDYEYFMDLDEQLFWPVKFVFALKPTVDAVSTLMFLGEYRQYPRALLRYVTSRKGKKGSFSRTTTLTRVRTSNFHTVSAAPTSSH